MKKLLTIISTLLAFILGLSACSCNPAVVLAFSATWTPNNKYETGFYEKLEYRVNQIDSYSNANLVVTKTNSDSFSVTYGEGSYVIETRSVDRNANEVLSSASKDSLYCLTSTFTIPVSYTFADGKTYEFTDSIISTVYFNSNSDSLAPVYSEKVYDATALSFNKGVYGIDKYSYKTIISWTNNRATLTIENVPEDLGEVDLTHLKQQTVSTYQKTLKFDEKTAIDNEELLFAIRGLALKEKLQQNIPLLDTSYKAFKTATIKCYEKETLNLSIALEKGTESQTITEMETILTGIYYVGNNFTGQGKACYYQSKEANGLSRNFMVKMIDPLPHGAGALEYSLTKITVNA